MRPDGAGASRRTSAPWAQGDFSVARVGSRRNPVTVRPVACNAGPRRGYHTCMRGRGVGFWHIIESERVARPMGTQD
jgi:hypothetical protein